MNRNAMFAEDFEDVGELMNTTLPPLNWWSFTVA